jgi:hypothetical protein
LKKGKISRAKNTAGKNLCQGKRHPAKKERRLCDRPYPKSATIDLQGFRSGAMNEILSKSGKD